MTVDLLDPALTEAWRRGRARRRDVIRRSIARARGIAPERVQLRRRTDGRVAVLVDAPGKQLEWPF